MAEILGEKIKRLRKENGLNQTQLAERIGVDKSAISFWENGINEPKANYITKLALLFNISADYLLGIEDEFGNKIEKQKTLEPEKIKLPAVARSKGNKLRNITLELTEEQLNTLIAEIKGDKE